MAIDNIIARGVGFVTTSVRYIITHGFDNSPRRWQEADASEGVWQEAAVVSNNWTEENTAADSWIEENTV